MKIQCTHVVFLALVATSAQAQRISASEMGAQLDAAGKQIEAAKIDLDLVEKQYTLRAEISDETSRLQRFSDGEIQYLLGDGFILRSGGE
jgi:hypothetical protein